MYYRTISLHFESKLWNTNQDFIMQGFSALWTGIFSSKRCFGFGRFSFLNFTPKLNSINKGLKITDSVLIVNYSLNHYLTTVRHGLFKREAWATNSFSCLLNTFHSQTNLNPWDRLSEWSLPSWCENGFPFCYGHWTQTAQKCGKFFTLDLWLTSRLWLQIPAPDTILPHVTALICVYSLLRLLDYKWEWSLHEGRAVCFSPNS